ncbi:MAG TPA: glycosyltransferase family 2 protein [Methanolinea sp.]|nr:glycosyltransferase family 2 protein [Methanolinea sp.]HQK56297.1 glycosyltransferase family 2 protein [Methanolinea sp.]
MEGDTDITVIIPTLNEEISISHCLSKIFTVFHDHSLVGEIIVSDSSTDRTPEIAASLGARVIRPERKGYGAAYLAAFPHARGKYIVIGDGDDTYDFAQIPALIEPLKRGADMVIGSRFNGEILPGAMTPLHQYIGNPVLTWMVNVLFDAGYSDVHSGFRAIRKEALERLDLRSPGMEFASEMMVRARQKGLVVEEVPITYYPRQAPSKLHSFADGWRHVRFVLLLNPLPFIAIPGAIFALVGFVLMILFALKGQVATSHLHSFILGAFLLCGGVQVVVIGILMKIYSVTHRYEQKAGIIVSVMNYHSLERLLFAGGLILVLGFLSGLSVIIAWIQSGFGQIAEIVNAVAALCLGTIGLQIIFMAIFTSMMLLREENGDNKKPA